MVCNGTGGGGVEWKEDAPRDEKLLSLFNSHDTARGWTWLRGRRTTLQRKKTIALANEPCKWWQPDFYGTGHNQTWTWKRFLLPTETLYYRAEEAEANEKWTMPLSTTSHSGRGSAVAEEEEEDLRGRIERYEGRWGHWLTDWLTEWLIIYIELASQL